MEEFATVANGHARGRKVRPLPRHLFKDSGIEVELRKLGPTTLQRITEALRRECMALPAGHERKYPEAPVERVEVGGEVREEVNERHPDHLEALDRWARWAMNETGIVGLAKSLAGWSPNFRIIHPRKHSAPSTMTPTRMFLR